MPRFVLDQSVDNAINSLKEKARQIGRSMDKVVIDQKGFCFELLDLEDTAEALRTSGYIVNTVFSPAADQFDYTLYGLEFSAPYPAQVFDRSAKVVVISQEELEALVKEASWFGQPHKISIKVKDIVNGWKQKLGI